MKQILKLAAVSLLAVIILAACSRAPAEQPPAQNDAPPAAEADAVWDIYNELAASFIESMNEQDFVQAIKLFDAAMTEAMDEAALQAFWNEITARAGDYIGIFDIENITHEAYFICNVTTRHEKTGALIRIVFDENFSLAGLFILEYPALEQDESGGESGGDLSAAAAKEPIVQDGFTDYPVTIGENTDFPLAGLLSLPHSQDGEDGAALPAVVIVHGSGPHDMDATIGENKPYRDIAEYLAAAGIAVLRYDKRTLAYAQMADGGWSVREEIILDAVRAANMLKADPRIDQGRVYIIGHSLGGALAPRIHAEGGDFAGLIILAGTPRFLMGISRDQNIAYAKENMTGAELEAALLELEENWDAQITAFVSLPDDEAKTAMVAPGMSAYYIKDLYNNPTQGYLAALDIPLLILQGENDVQISVEADFALYKELLKDYENAAFKLYPGLNHMFTENEKAPIAEVVEQYAIPAQISREVLEDIAKWVLSR